MYVTIYFAMLTHVTRAVWSACNCVFMSGVPTAAGEEEAPGGLLLSAAGQGRVGEEVCLYTERADPAGTTPRRDQVGGGWVRR